MATILLVVQRYLQEGGGSPAVFPLGAHLTGWVQFDGPEYLAISVQGYQQHQLVWFPLYPMTVRIVDWLAGDPVLSAVVVSLLAGAAAAGLWWRWLEHAVAPAARVTCFLVLMLYPYGWFLYGVVYSDAMFLAFAVGAFFALEKDRPLLAGALGALATATRPSGAAVAAGLLVLALERSGAVTVEGGQSTWRGALRIPARIDFRRADRSVAAVSLAWAGLAVYGLYQWVAWGSPVRFLSEQSNYHDRGRGTYLKQQYFEQWLQDVGVRSLATTTAQALILLLTLAMVPAIGRRFGWGYSVLVGGLAVLPALSVATFMGTGRYLIPAFPAFALFGEWLSERRRSRWVWLAASGTTMFLLAAGFSRSWYLT